MSNATEIERATPLFPLGSPRSGTTLLTRILNAHPKILMTDETTVLLQLYEIITKSRIGRPAGIIYGKSYTDLWADHLQEHSKQLIDSYYERIRVIESKEQLSYWGEKHPHHSQGHCLKFIEELYPTCRYIYIVRDPRDTALSIAAMNKIEFSKALNTWKLFADRYEKYFDSLSKQNFFHLRYEDLVANYADVSKRMFEWLGLEFTEEVNQFLRDYKDVDAHTIRRHWRQKANFGEQSVERWKRELTKPDRDYARNIAGTYMDKYGYEQ